MGADGVSDVGDGSDGDGGAAGATTGAAAGAGRGAASWWLSPGGGRAEVQAATAVSTAPATAHHRGASLVARRPTIAAGRARCTTAAIIVRAVAGRIRGGAQAASEARVVSQVRATTARASIRSRSSTDDGMAPTRPDAISSTPVR
jgi:hypothetical protein